MARAPRPAPILASTPAEKATRRILRPWVAQSFSSAISTLSFTSGFSRHNQSSSSAKRRYIAGEHFATCNCAPQPNPVRPASSPDRPFSPKKRKSSAMNCSSATGCRVNALPAQKRLHVAHLIHPCCWAWTSCAMAAEPSSTVRAKSCSKTTSCYCPPIRRSLKSSKMSNPTTW